MREKMRVVKSFVIVAVFLMAVAGIAPVKANAATASVSTDRKAGKCTYTVKELDTEAVTQITVRVTRSDNDAMVMEKTIDLTEENCADGTFTGSFTLDDLSTYSYASYRVSVYAGEEKITAGNCDFSIHNSKIHMSVGGSTGDAVRTVRMTSSEPSGGVLVPGAGNQVYVMAWKQGQSESTARIIAAHRGIAGNSITWSANITQAGRAYGGWNAKLVLVHAKMGAGKTLAKTGYTVEPVRSSFITRKTKALEKKKSFGVYLKGLKNAYGVKTVKFRVYNSKGKKVHTVTAQKKKADGSLYYAAVKLKSLKYKLGTYKIKTVITDAYGKTCMINATAVANENVSGGKLSVVKKTNATCMFKMTNAYIPGNIKQVKYVVYQKVKGKQKKVGSYKAKSSSAGKKFTASVKNTKKGKFVVYAYGYTQWGKKVLLNRHSYTLKQKHMGKNGWRYEKYQGKKYKFYYINNEKQTDLTKILKLKKSSTTHTNRFIVEVNRAAGVVTIYMYNKDTKKYDIPVKTCTVSVGRDISTVAGTSGLHEDSSYTPIGNYSICTNGIAVKYSLKTMHEPDGSIVYARWCSHIVGNVYFHAVAVGSQSHYALNAYSYNRLGSPASAGCIRMTVADAKWLYDYVSTGTPVKIVKGSSSKPGPLGKNPTIKIQGSINYDPTDPEVPDSRKKKDYKAKRISGYMTKSGKKVGY